MLNAEELTGIAASFYSNTNALYAAVHFIIGHCPSLSQTVFQAVTWQA
jgi:hypothetical protein